MIEKIILDYLSEQFEIPCVLEMPEEFTAPLILVEKLGSGKSNKICNASIAVQSYGASLYDAASLNEAVKSAMENAIVLDDICAVNLDSDYNYTDSNKRRYRYQAVFDIVHY